MAVTISVLNSKSAPISFDNTFCTLTDADQNVYDSVSGLHKADVSFHADLNPGVKVSEKLVGRDTGWHRRMIVPGRLLRAHYFFSWSCARQASV